MTLEALKSLSAVKMLLSTGKGGKASQAAGKSSFT